jgi:hypothetical protein
MVWGGLVYSTLGKLPWQVTGTVSPRGAPERGHAGEDMSGPPEASIQAGTSGDAIQCEVVVLLSLTVWKCCLAPVVRVVAGARTLLGCARLPIPLALGGTVEGCRGWRC